MTDQNEKTDVQFLTAEVRSLRKSVDQLTAGLEQMHANMKKEFAQQGQRVERCTLLTFQLHNDLQKGEGVVPVIEGIALQSGVVDEHGEVYSAEALAQMAGDIFNRHTNVTEGNPPLPIPVKIEEGAEEEVDKLLASLKDTSAAEVLPFKKDTCKK